MVRYVPRYPPFPPSPTSYREDSRPSHILTVQPTTGQKTCPVPTRQIRAHFDSDTITVYQAYNAAIADAAVAAQKLDASPLFKITRMTWIKPSFMWMMYRCGWATKENQERVLAIKMRHEHFAELLSQAVPTDQITVCSIKPSSASASLEMPRMPKLITHQKLTDCANKHSVRMAVRTKSTDVHIQWDPERNFHLDKLPIRSIQIGIPACLVQKWIDEWIVSIKDVTDSAREFRCRDTAWKDKESFEVWCYRLGWLPYEAPYDDHLSRAVRRRIGMEDEE
ncbi:hypothetical protein TD95_000738 [Thielaviopsis punctulata]|uniref:DUF4291 domain-containing protein n=1 Tax=Thielaviopsis punctulata TaxID=72032 RepID=A0A0F4ZJY7_9PEZI|nr:hypothetical protein TD95_000738 [Thielaviopsis punctulata]